MKEMRDRPRLKRLVDEDELNVAEEFLMRSELLPCPSALSSMNSTRNASAAAAAAAAAAQPPLATWSPSICGYMLCCAQAAGPAHQTHLASLGNFASLVPAADNIVVQPAIRFREM